MCRRERPAGPTERTVVQYRFHHVALSVKDRRASVEFYERFGFREVLVWEAEDGSLSITHLRLGDSTLELFNYRDAFDDADRRSEPGNNLLEIGPKHLALVTESLEKSHRELADVGGLTAITEGRTGLRYFFVPDPDGIWVEVVEPSRAGARALRAAQPGDVR
jgi:glyoxylase I family protein